MNIQSLEDLLRVQIQTLYSIESQLMRAIPIMAQNAQFEKLRDALQEHLDTTRQQAQRLEEIGRDLNIDLNGPTDQGMMHMIKDEEMRLEQISDPTVKDTAIMGGTDKVEHYEMAAYESTINVAKKLNMDEVADKLEETYNEEKRAAEGIKTMASGGIFGRAAQALS